eukprot:12177659-Ditylum_brightwellii.AAC.1
MKNGAEGLFDIDAASKLKDQYPEVRESVDEKVPEPLFDELAITTYVNSDHAHAKLTWPSITRAEFMAMKTAVEEVMSLIYMFWCLGVEVTKITCILGYKRSVFLLSLFESGLAAVVLGINGH